MSKQLNFVQRGHKVIAKLHAVRHEQEKTLHVDNTEGPQNKQWFHFIYLLYFLSRKAYPAKRLALNKDLLLLITFPI